MARDTQRHIVTGRAAIAIYNITSTLMDALRDELKEKFGDDLANNDALLEESAHTPPSRTPTSLTTLPQRCPTLHPPRPRRRQLPLEMGGHEVGDGQGHPREAPSL